VADGDVRLLGGDHDLVETDLRVAGGEALRRVVGRLLGLARVADGAGEGLAEVLRARLAGHFAVGSRRQRGRRDGTGSDAVDGRGHGYLPICSARSAIETAVLSEVTPAS